MEARDLEIIKQLMSQLQDEMKPSGDDFEERLGRKKPGIEIMKVEGKLPGDMDPMSTDMDSMDPKKQMAEKLADKLGMSDDMEKDSDLDSVDKPMMKDDMGDDAQFDFDEDEGMFKPKDAGLDLKKRLMALRGR